MLLIKTKNAVLQDIKDAIGQIIGANQSLRSLVLTDEDRHDILKTLVTYSDKIPHPAHGMTNINGEPVSTTLIRWQILAYVASIDLTIAKWFESHLDALSILHEVGYEHATDGLWAIWAAEGHHDPIRYDQGRISGTKSWCSGAHLIDYALMTYRDDQGHSQLVSVAMHQSGITVDTSEWHAVGMKATDTATVQFDHVAAHNVGASNAYLNRVGFWHGAAGVAACWYGAAASLASYLITAYQQKPGDYKAMYLGEISTALAVTQHYFYHIASLIDIESHCHHELAIRELRSQVEQVARLVIATVGQALGAAPFCNNAHFARLSADLAVFIRQSHGAFDLQKIGELSSVLASSLTDDENNNLSNNIKTELQGGRENIWQL